MSLLFERPADRPTDLHVAETHSVDWSSTTIRHAVLEQTGQRGTSITGLAVPRNSYRQHAGTAVLGSASSTYRVDYHAIADWYFNGIADDGSAKCSIVGTVITAT